MDVDHDTAGLVREALLLAGFTAEGVLGRIGAAALTAAGRDLLEPVRRALTSPVDADDSPGNPPGQQRTLDALIRVFLLGEAVAEDDLPVGLAQGLRSLGLIASAVSRPSDDPGARPEPDRRTGHPPAAEPGETVRAVLDLRPYGEPDTDWYLVSDLGTPEQADHVLGLGGASLTLARITPRTSVATVMDLGCGSGVQVLHASRHAERIVATDTNPRALHLTELSAALSGVPPTALELRQGSLFEPVVDERFDLIVANPPFVISPGHRFTYRDAGLAGDDLSRLVVQGAAERLAPGGRAALLCNWLHRPDQIWQERVTSWLGGAAVDAWVVQRDLQDVVEYAATWLRDSGTQEADLDASLGTWLDEFARLGATGVGFGWVVLHAHQDADREPWVVTEDLGSSGRLPNADEVAEFLDGCALVERLGAVGLLAGDARLADGVRIVRGSVLVSGQEVGEPPMLERPGSVGPTGWRGFEPVPPTLLSALLDPRPEPLGARLDAAADQAGLEPLDVLPVALARLRELLRVGIVRP